MSKSRRHFKLAAFLTERGSTMKCSKRPLVFVSVLFAMLLSFNAGTLNARDADEKPLTLAAAQSSKQKHINACRARYRDCLRLNQIPSFECQYIYQDCINHIV
jgi:hypothetical protein